MTTEAERLFQSIFPIFSLTKCETTNPNQQIPIKKCAKSTIRLLQIFKNDTIKDYGNIAGVPDQTTETTESFITKQHFEGFITRSFTCYKSSSLCMFHIEETDFENNLKTKYQLIIHLQNKKPKLRRRGISVVL